MIKKIIIATLGVLCFSYSETRAQDLLTMNGDYHQVYFIDMLKDLGLRYNLRFFHDHKYDSIKIDLTFSSLDLQAVLDQVTYKYTLNFVLKNKRNVIVTGPYKVETQIDKRLFGSNKDTIQSKSNQHKSINNDIGELLNLAREDVAKDRWFTIGDRIKKSISEQATIDGYISEFSTGEPVIGASVYISDPIVGVVTDQFGYYSITLPTGKYELHVRYIGMNPTQKKINLYSDGPLSFELKTDIISLKEIVVSGEQNILEGTQTGYTKLNINNIKEIPSVMGEADIMKIVLTLPGVQTVGEGAAGFNVRGGSADQNLVLLNEVPIYNTNHLFGFFSVFNPDVIASANLYKSGIGAQYGGRIASVFDVKLRDGNKKKFSFKGGITPITGKITIEGPIIKDKSSYIMGLRSTYSDWMLSLLNDPVLRNSSGGFSDMVGKVNHQINDKNIIILSVYHSRDHFSLNADSLYQYFNSNASIQWRHTFSNKLNLTTSMSLVDYNYSLSSDINLFSSFDIFYQIGHTSAKAEFSYFPSRKIKVKFGLDSKRYKLQPGQKNPLNAISLVIPIKLPNEKGLETGIFAGSEFNLSNKFSLYGGLRFSIFNALGPGQSFNYLPDTPKEIEFISDTIYYLRNQIIKSFHEPELRLSGRYQLRKDLSIKFSYDRMIQYLHVLTNTAAISPTDTWRLSSTAINPQKGNQYSLGLYRTFLGSSLELTGEVYYKEVTNVLEYKAGAELLLNETLETDIIAAKSKSYGLEILLKKGSGKFSGWLSYTYARSLIQANGIFNTEIINGGVFYPSNFDKPHALVLVTNLKINRRFNISLNVDYSSGRPATFPATKYRLKDQPILLYTDRNKYRIPNYFRMDLAFNFEGNHKVHKKIHGSWSFSIYNLTNRANAYSVYFKSEHGQINGYKLSIFKQAIPTLTYHFEFQ